MSVLTEWIKLIPDGVKNPMAIAEGIINSVKLEHGGLPEDKKDEIIRRRLICEGCPLLSKNATTSKEFFDLVGYHYSTARTDVHCSMCGCPIETRTASLKKPCGISKWNETNPTKQLELKWEVYNGKGNSSED